MSTEKTEYTASGLENKRYDYCKRMIINCNKSIYLVSKTEKSNEMWTEVNQRIQYEWLTGEK